MAGAITNQHRNLECTIKPRCVLAGRLTKQGNLAGKLSIGPDDINTYILVDQSGYEVAAVLVDEKAVLTATANDIRIGTVAVTEKGITQGEKFIPSYQTKEGVVRISPGRQLAIKIYSDLCQYTRLQVIICAYNTSISNSVSAEMVVINDNVYNVRSVDERASVTVDTENQAINLGIYNDSGNYLVIRYFTYRED